MSNAFLTLKDLTLGYGNSVAVDRLNLSMQKGELIALLGPSGCGKTTTMRAIAGLMKPMSGQITLDGRDITKVAPNKRDIGLVFQSYALFPHLNVFENVAFGLRLQRIGKDELTQRVNSALASVGLSQFADRMPKAMSGGQQQRVALARSIVMAPKLLLLDEPLSNLDARLRLEMRSELARLQKELGITMIYVTHDQAEALALADRIIVMRQGFIEQIGSPSDIYDHPKSAFVAEFIGYENCFEIQGHTLKGQQGQLDIQGQMPAAKGAGWRPRHVTLGQGPHQATVLGASYTGEGVEYLLASPAGQIKAETPANAPRYDIGATVKFDLPFEKAALFHQS